MQYTYTSTKIQRYKGTKVVRHKGTKVVQVRMLRTIMYVYYALHACITCMHYMQCAQYASALIYRFACDS